jgi:hypothetical protein
LNDNDAVKDEIPQGERPAEAARGS